jgi:hypothetical protein
MSAYSSDCASLDPCGSCGTLPSAFVRLRYFYGKRMGVTDFVDEQRYHSGKLKFHNQRLHGAGVLCGLGVTRQDPTQVLLRVGKGAAVDTCGREIVVGHDQCIDLDAWFQRELDERRTTDSTWPETAVDRRGNLPVVVVIRYRDCMGGPEPAPRDPCGCDATGCELGRVREEFELAVMPANDPDAASVLPLTPARDALEKAVGGALGGTSLARALADAASTSCPVADGNEWLLLATLTLTVTTTTTASGPTLHVTDLSVPTGAATLLAETALLQDLLTREIGAQLDAGALVGGPEIAKLSLVRDGTTAFYWLTLELTSGVIAETVPSEAFTLTKLATTGTPGWSSAPVKTDYVAPSGSARAQIRVRVDNSGDFLEKGRLYRLALDPAKVSAATPIVDDKLRVLRPVRGSLHFGIEQPGAGLEVVPPPYAR